MSSKWFNKYCRLDRHDQDIICDRIVNITNMPSWANIYGSVVFEEKLSAYEVERLIRIFRGKLLTEPSREVQKLLLKLERLRSQC